MEPTMSMYVSKEKCFKARAEYFKSQRDDLLAALKGLVDCISETRGKNADDALFKAKTAIENAEGL